MKYIVIEAKFGSGGMEIPFIFPNNLVHEDVAESMLHYLFKIHEWTDTRVVAAGELSLAAAGFECYGYSQTLKIKSRGDVDTRLIQMHDYGGGMM